MQIKIINYNHKNVSKYWQPEWPDVNFLVVELIKNGFTESYFYSSMEG